MWISNIYPIITKKLGYGVLMVTIVSQIIAGILVKFQIITPEVVGSKTMSNQ
jgi:hypothetical protein